ncbi:porin family protein [Chryseobacterium tructae]|uniref:Porin family protein n=1 Tax=Chryseobacterium tructae TaxID=1037380 RepID=A0ABV7XYX6_9FLAO|nr:porin family protein [Chryseobacterium tructae]MDN3693241.1 porin family protein [Chryseobacterium tructae]
MKKLFVGLAFAGSLFINAQEKTKSSSPITFGVKAGINATTISRTNDTYSEGYYDNDQKMKAGFNAGVFVNIPVAEKFSVQPELLFSQLGSKSEVRYRNSNGKFTSTVEASDKVNLNYIVLPLMVQYNILPQLYVEAGPEFGLLLGGKSKSDVTITNGSENFTSSQSDKYSDKINMDRFNKFNFGIGIGAGYYFTPQFGVTARFIAGVTDVLKSDYVDFKSRNNAFQVGVAYKFK